LVMEKQNNVQVLTINFWGNNLQQEKNNVERICSKLLFISENKTSFFPTRRE